MIQRAILTADGTLRPENGEFLTGFKKSGADMGIAAACRDTHQSITVSAADWEIFNPLGSTAARRVFCIKNINSFYILSQFYSIMTTPGPVPMGQVQQKLNPKGKKIRNKNEQWRNGECM